MALTTFDDEEGLILAAKSAGATGFLDEGKAVSCGTNSRRLRQTRLDAWLKANRVRIERESPNAIGLELRRLGFYSKKTTLTDIRVGFHKRCCCLGISREKIV
jgi:hypothetical protein